MSSTIHEEPRSTTTYRSTKGSAYFWENVWTQNGAVRIQNTNVNKISISHLWNILVYLINAFEIWYFYITKNLQTSSINFQSFSKLKILSSKTHWHQITQNKFNVIMLRIIYFTRQGNKYDETFESGTWLLFVLQWPRMSKISRYRWMLTSELTLLSLY